MIIESVRVQNFRSILDETLACEQLTALVGANGSGKSSFLRAIELFYAPDPKVAVEDFFAENTASDIQITVTFGELSAPAAQRFAKYLEQDTLTVTRIISLRDGVCSARLHGSMMQNADLAAVRAISSKTELRAKYNELRAQAEYATLPSVRSADDALQAMAAWESEHPDTCVRTSDEGQFFGFKQVGQGYLGDHTRFIFIPAVRDAADDAAEGRGSAITELMDLVVRSALARREDLSRLRERVQAEYEQIVDPAKLTELGDLGEKLTGTLNTYAPDAAVDLSWLKAGSIDLPPPKAQVRLVEDGFRASVDRTGHGLQRDFILTLLQHLTLAKSSPPQTEAAEPNQEPALPNLTIAIEEPELYQHPSRQRHIAKVLAQLASGSIPGVAGRTQIIYATHSPLFVGTDRFDQVRLARKVDTEPDRPKRTKLVWSAWAQVADELWTLRGSQGPKFTPESCRARLHAIMTPWMNEGFFAKVVVLVEGEGDRAAIVGAGAALGHDFDAEGVAVIPCMGKANLDRPALIFRRLGIPTYIIWDSDQGGNGSTVETTHVLLKLVGQPREDYPERVSDVFACFKQNMETTLKNELGAALYDELVNQVGQDLGITKRTQTTKNPVAIHQVLERAAQQGKTSPTLGKIVERIVALETPSIPAGVETAA